MNLLLLVLFTCWMVTAGMTIFKDIFTGDIMFDDTNTYELIEDGAVYKVYGKSTKGKVGGEDFNLIPDEEEEEDMESGVDIVLNQRLQEVPFESKEEIFKYLKKYRKKLLEKVPDNKKDEVISKFQVYDLYLRSKFKDLQYFQGESADYRTGEAMVGMLTYVGEDPVMYFFRCGLEEEKV